jgi:hypothetical protein
MSSAQIYVTDGLSACRIDLTSNVPFYQLRGQQGAWDQVRPFARFIPPCGLYYYEDGFLHLGDVAENAVVTIPFPWGQGMTPGAVGVGHLVLYGPRFVSGDSPRPLGPKVAFKVLKATYDWPDTWFGLGIKGDVQVVTSKVGGRKEGIVGFMVNLSTRQLAFVMVEAHLKDRKSNWNQGGGASACVSVLLATGVKTASALTGTPTGGWDVNVAIGGAWSKFFTCLSRAQYYSKLVTALPKVMPAIGEIGTLGANAAKSEEFMTWSKSFVVGSGVDPTSRSLNVWDTPVGVGLEISCAETEGTIYASANIFDLNVVNAFLRRIADAAH